MTGNFTLWDEVPSVHPILQDAAEREGGFTASWLRMKLDIAGVTPDATFVTQLLLLARARPFVAKVCEELVVDGTIADAFRSWDAFRALVCLASGRHEMSYVKHGMMGVLAALANARPGIVIGHYLKRSAEDFKLDRARFDILENLTLRVVDGLGGGEYADSLRKRVHEKYERNRTAELMTA